MNQTLKQQYEHLIALRLLDSVDNRKVPVMPSYYVSVPTITTYGSVPMGSLGDENGKLGTSPPRDTSRTE